VTARKDERTRARKGPLAIGDVVQVNPGAGLPVACCLFIVKEVRDDDCDLVAAVATEKVAERIATVPGVARTDVARIGPAKWVPFPGREDELMTDVNLAQTDRINFAYTPAMTISRVAGCLVTHDFTHDSPNDTPRAKRVSVRRRRSCPSWARTRTLLIQRLSALLCS
jgi:hypothetical protein